MGQCLSVCEKLFQKAKGKGKNQKKSNQLDGNKENLKKPFLDSSNYIQGDRGGDDSDGEQRKRIGDIYGDQRKQSISIEMQERRVMAERQRELDEMEKEELEEQKRWSQLRKDLALSKTYTTISNLTSPQIITLQNSEKIGYKINKINPNDRFILETVVPPQSSSHSQQMNSNDFLKTKKADYYQQKQQQQQSDFDSKYQKQLILQNQKQGLSSVSTQEQAEKEEEDHNQEEKPKRSVRNISYSKRESQRKRDSKRQNQVESYQNVIIPNSLVQKKERNNDQRGFKDIEEQVNNEQSISGSQIEIDEFKNEKWKHIDPKNQIVLQDRYSSESFPPKTEVSMNKNEQEGKDDNDQEEEDEENIQQKEEKLNQIRKSLQQMNLTRNSTFQIHGGQTHYNPSHTQQSAFSQQGMGHPISVPSFVQDFSKISSIPLPQAQSVSQNLNQFGIDETDLSLLLADSQKNSIFVGNNQQNFKDSKFLLDESIIHPIKHLPSTNGVPLQNGDQLDSDNSSRKEEENICVMKKQQSINDLILLLQQATTTYPQNGKKIYNDNNHSKQQNNNCSQQQDAQQIQRSSVRSVRSESGKLFKQKSKEDEIDYEKEKQIQEQIDNSKGSFPQFQISSSSSIAGINSKKDQFAVEDQISSNKQQLQSRKGSKTNMNKQNILKQSQENIKSVHNSEENLLPIKEIKEEESKCIGEMSATNQYSNTNNNNNNNNNKMIEAHEFSFCAEKQNDNNNIEESKMTQPIQTADLTQKSETSPDEANSLQNESNQQQSQKNKQNQQFNNQSDTFSYQTSPSKKQRKFSDSSQDQDQNNQKQEEFNIFSNRFSLRQPSKKPLAAKVQAENISIVIQDPRNVTTEQFVFTIHPYNSKQPTQQQASVSHRDSVLSQSNGESTLNKTMPHHHKSLLENTNRVIMQKRPSRKSLQQSSSAGSIAQNLSKFMNNTQPLQANSIQSETDNKGSTDQIESGEVHSFSLKNSYQQASKNKLQEIPIKEHKDEDIEDDKSQEEEEKNDNPQIINQKIESREQKALQELKQQVPGESTQNLQSLTENENKIIQEDQELPQQVFNQQDQVFKNGNQQTEEEEEKQSINEIIHSPLPHLSFQMNTSNNHDFNTIGHGITHCDSYNNFNMAQQNIDEEENAMNSISSPQIGPRSLQDSNRASQKYFSVQSGTNMVNPNSQRNIQLQNTNSYSDSPFYTCFNTPQISNNASKRESQYAEPRLLSQQEFQQRKSMINESKQISYYRKTSAYQQYYDCDSYQLQVIDGDQLQNRDLLEQPELYMQWLNSLNKKTPESFSNEANYQFEIIKQETYQDFLYKFEQEYFYNLELFDPIIQSKTCNIYFRSEISLNQERLYIITGEYYVNTSSYAAFYNFKNSASIQTILNSYDYIYSINEDIQNTVLYANCSSRYLEKPCEFVYLKHFSFLQYNNEAGNNGEQPEQAHFVEQMCEIDISLNSEEIEQFVKKNKKSNNVRGELFSGNIATYIPETNQIKVEILIEQNFHNAINTQQAKSMFTDMFTNYIKKLNYAFP
ncbi:hypothetical protein TTHERM_00672250 (macronuclear) [Tetrahymena thermophila SB210]|uniref:Uncharacterized protein n=1 Tax=Tetrahymena thermophila (strain SB210) TaxID=312017 RepID=Q23E30_TETTS|nr:hypothetical protein TTHERM_00672250 [Tetrahymena thermophila SB210]EAR94757.1 hypothetical protein TTHERM_00672250 [Tetrahymena thermophila SB210]|eukprot:XP_001015002.1 hypothetical protein TTHERM_00672250 [Tetrahymena thermophila SB210]